MKKKLRTIPLLRNSLSLGLAAMLVCAPFSAAAATLDKPIIITEVQVGTSVSASQEFIELYNQSASVIDLAADSWQIQIATSRATSWEKPKTVALSGKFYPGTYMLISSNYIKPGETKGYLQEYATAQFTPGMTAASGHIRLAHANTADADLAGSDVLEWSGKDSSGAFTSPGIDGGRVFPLDNSLGDGESIKRAINETGVFLASGDFTQDFLLSSCPSPTANNRISSSSGQSLSEPVATSIDVANPSCESTDSDPEEGGGTTQPTEDPPAILLPSDEPTAEVSSTAKIIPRMPAADIGLASPQLSEILPNPASPQTDAQDEFIELYNSNYASFDLSGFILEMGTTGSRHYTFPEGTTVAPRSFVAFFSANTRASLSNTSGQVKLLDPFQKPLSQTDSYGSAKDGQAWALANGKWQWTTKPSPNAINTIAAPVAKTAKSKTGTAKTTATKTAATNNKAATSTKPSDMAMASATQPESPLHPLVLAVVGGFALLYGGYEYRHDLANKFHQLRSYRAARRKNRQSTARR